MILGRVCGTVVATVQHPFYRGKKQLIVRAITPDGAFDENRYVVAVDLVGAGIGETVIVEDEGNSARQLLNAPKEAPVRSVIVGIVDRVTETMGGPPGKAGLPPQSPHESAPAQAATRASLPGSST